MTNENRAGVFLAHRNGIISLVGIEEARSCRFFNDSTCASQPCPQLEQGIVNFKLLCSMTLDILMKRGLISLNPFFIPQVSVATAAS